MVSLFELPYWFSITWFNWKQLSSYSWSNGWVLYLLPLIVLLPILRWLFNFKGRQKVYSGNTVSLQKVEYTIALLRYVPRFVFQVFVSLIIIALARPQTVTKDNMRQSKGLDLLFVVDISESMMLEDFKPNRLEVAKKILVDFVKKREQDKIGVVVFSGAGYTLVPLTTDYELIQNRIAQIAVNKLDTGSSAIGNALGLGINRLRESESNTKIIILLSDGDNTAGNLGPETAAMLARKFNIIIHTIGIGKNGEAPFGKDANGRTQYVASVLNESTLKSIATISKGLYYRASDKRALANCLAQISNHAKNSFTINYNVTIEDYYQIYLYWSLLFLLLWLAIKSSFMNNFLED